MSEKLTYTGRVKDGAAILPRAKMRAEIARLFEGKDIEITIQRRKRHRSNPQNAFYWAVVVPMVQMGIKDLGEYYDATEVHDLLRMKFLEVVKIDGTTGEELYRTIRSTSSLTTVEFIEYLEKCSQWAAEWLGITIPEPQ